MNDLLLGQYQLSVEQTTALVEEHSVTKKYCGRAIIDPLRSKIWLPVENALMLLIIEDEDRECPFCGAHG